MVTYPVCSLLGNPYCDDISKDPDGRRCFCEQYCALSPGNYAIHHLSGLECRNKSFADFKDMNQKKMNGPYHVRPRVVELAEFTHVVDHVVSIS